MPTSRYSRPIRVQNRLYWSPANSLLKDQTSSNSLYLTFVTSSALNSVRPSFNHWRHFKQAEAGKKLLQEPLLSQVSAKNDFCSLLSWSLFQALPQLLHLRLLPALISIGFVRNLEPSLFWVRVRLFSTQSSDYPLS